MVISTEIKDLIAKVDYVPLVTVSSQGVPHLIAVGQVKEVKDNDVLSFGIWKMEQTQKNVKETGIMQVVLATRADGAKGYRLSGKATIEGEEILFKAETAQSLV